MSSDPSVEPSSTATISYPPTSAVEISVTSGARLSRSSYNGTTSDSSGDAGVMLQLGGVGVLGAQPRQQGRGFRRIVLVRAVDLRQADAGENLAVRHGR